MKSLFFVFILLFSLKSFSQDTITTSQVKDYIDKIVVVKGKVASLKLAKEGKNINYINIDKAYPENVFSVIITNDHLQLLNLKVEDLKDKLIYVKGKIVLYKNDPKQIPEIYNPLQLDVKKQ